MDERSERIAQRFERPLLMAAALTIPVTGPADVAAPTRGARSRMH